ncbi:MAG TPA: hypothetical protein VJ011_02890 [Steroidobacteraceae bacterium]|nr:hypothetical protein [Steroidobacteraceae bacterium]
MVRSRLSYLFVLPLAMVLMGAKLADPDPIAVPSGLSAKDVSKAIRSSIVQRGWAITKDAGGQIDATLNVRTHTARVAIGYDARNVRIRYVDSSNLDYEEKQGGRLIHRNYLRWIQNMVADISRSMQAAAIEKEG